MIDLHAMPRPAGLIPATPANARCCELPPSPSSAAGSSIVSGRIWISEGCEPVLRAGAVNSSAGDTEFDQQSTPRASSRAAQLKQLCLLKRLVI